MKWIKAVSGRARTRVRQERQIRCKLGAPNLGCKFKEALLQDSESECLLKFCTLDSLTCLTLVQALVLG